MRAIRGLAFLALATVTAGHVAARQTREEPQVDMALIVSVDVSGSVDENRYTLQMTGIAKALEDPEVIAAMISGPRRSIMLTMVEWSERAVVAIPWTRIASRDDAAAFAAQVRRTPRLEGEFTCIAHMMSFVSDTVLPTLPVKARRVVMDVSGDGIDNCDGDEATGAARDQLTIGGMTINGLPIHQGDPAAPVGGGAFRAPGRPFQNRSLPPEIKTLEPWYRQYVIGGDGAFMVPAYGYNDFDRAIKQKFAIEISARPVPAATNLAWASAAAKGR